MPASSSSFAVSRPALMRKTLYFHHDYLNDLVPAWAKDKTGLYSMLANSPEDVPRIAQTIDSMFINTDAPTKTESEREFAASFQAMYGGVKQFMYGIIGAITFSLLLVMGNTMAMSVRERTKEVGTLKAIGFQRGTIARLFVGEALLVSAIGGLIGVGGSLLIFRSIDFSFIHSERDLVCADQYDVDYGAAGFDSGGPG
jgi:putative ABC transport system permease protein